MATIVCCLNAWHAGTIIANQAFHSTQPVSSQTAPVNGSSTYVFPGGVWSLHTSLVQLRCPLRVGTSRCSLWPADTPVRTSRSLFVALILNFFFCGRLRAHAGLGLERGPSTSGEAVGSDWNRQRVWEPREFVRSSLCFQPLRVAHRVVHHPLHVGSGHMCGKRLGALTTIHRCS